MQTSATGLVTLASSQAASASSGAGQSAKGFSPAPASAGSPGVGLKKSARPVVRLASLPVFGGSSVAASNCAPAARQAVPPSASTLWSAVRGSGAGIPIPAGHPRCPRQDPVRLRPIHAGPAVLRSARGDLAGAAGSRDAPDRARPRPGPPPAMPSSTTPSRSSNSCAPPSNALSRKAGGSGVSSVTAVTPRRAAATAAIRTVMVTGAGVPNNSSVTPGCARCAGASSPPSAQAGSPGAACRSGKLRCFSCICNFIRFAQPPGLRAATSAAGDRARQRHAGGRRIGEVERAHRDAALPAVVEEGRHRLRQQHAADCIAEGRAECGA